MLGLPGMTADDAEVAQILAGNPGNLVDRWSQLSEGSGVNAGVPGRDETLVAGEQPLTPAARDRGDEWALGEIWPARAERERRDLARVAQKGRYDAAQGQTAADGRGEIPAVYEHMVGSARPQPEVARLGGHLALLDAGQQPALAQRGHRLREPFAQAEVAHPAAPRGGGPRDGLDGLGGLGQCGHWACLQHEELPVGINGPFHI